MCFNILIYQAFIFFEIDELHYKKRIQTHLYLSSQSLYIIAKIINFAFNYEVDGSVYIKVILVYTLVYT